MKNLPVALKVYVIKSNLQHQQVKRTSEGSESIEPAQSIDSENKIRKALCRLGLGLMLLAGGVSMAHAVAPSSSVNIDFQGGSNTYSGVGVLGSASDTFWNSVGLSGGTNLLYADGTGSSGVSITTTLYTNTYNNNVQINPLLNDWLYTFNGQPTITISGLAPNSTVDIALYDGFYWQDFTVPTQSGLIAQVRPDSSLGSANAPPFPAGAYGILRGVISDNIGQITILDTSVPGGRFGKAATIAGMQIALVNTQPIANAGADQNIYLGQTAMLNGSASSGLEHAPLTYAWTLDTFPAGSTAVLVGANTVNPSLIPDVVGTYNFSLKVNNGASDSAAAKVAVNVSENLPPVAVATGTPFSGAAPLQVIFDASTSSDPEFSALTYNWNFGDTTNNTSTAASPSHTYNAVGNYTAVVTVMDSFGKTDQASVPVTVLAPNLPPVILPSATPNNGAAPLAVQFDANATDVNLGDTLSYSWDFGDGSVVSTETNPLHIYASLGTYTAKVSVSDEVNQPVMASLTISVSSSLTIHVTEAKVQPGAKGKVEGKVSMKATFAYTDMPLAKDIIRVKFDGVTLLEVPFDSFKLDSTNKYEYALKDREAEIDFNRHTIEVSRHKMLMTGIDNSNGIDVEVSFGPATGNDHADMRRDKDDGKGNKKDDHVSDYSYKRD
ncbi:MAG: PKD domain-containing protein [Methylococcales bacterium]|nr:PKD domain-containing protein [Methylococcales bacterium]